MYDELAVKGRMDTCVSQLRVSSSPTSSACQLMDKNYLLSNQENFCRLHGLDLHISALEFFMYQQASCQRPNSLQAIQVHHIFRRLETSKSQIRINLVQLKITQFGFLSVQSLNKSILHLVLHASIEGASAARTVRRYAMVGFS